MNPHEDRFVVHGGEVAHGEREVFDPVEFGSERVTGEFTPLGRDVCRRLATDEFLGLSPVPDEVGNRDHQQTVSVRKHAEFVGSGHSGFVSGDDLTQQTSRLETGKACQIDRCLGVPRPFQHATVAASSGKMCPGRARSVGAVSELASALIVAARSLALIPVEVPARLSTLTRNAVFILSVLSATIGSRRNSLARSVVIAVHKKPDV